MTSTQTPSVNASTLRNREAAERRKRGAVMLPVTLESADLDKLVARGLLKSRSDREAIAVALLTYLRADAAPPQKTVAAPKTVSSLMSPTGYLGVRPDFEIVEYPKYLAAADVTVKDAEEEAAVLARTAGKSAATAPPPAATAPVSDWQKLSIALDQQGNEAREREERRQLDAAMFVIRK